MDIEKKIEAAEKKIEVIKKRKQNLFLEKANYSNKNNGIEVMKVFIINKAIKARDLEINMTSTEIKALKIEEKFEKTGAGESDVLYYQSKVSYSFVAQEKKKLKDACLVLIQTQFSNQNTIKSLNQVVEDKIE